MKYTSVFDSDTSLSEMQETIRRMYYSIGVQLEDVKSDIEAVSNQENIQKAKQLRKLLLNIQDDIRALRAGLLDVKIRVKNDKREVDILFSDSSELSELYEVRNVTKDVTTLISERVDTLRNNLDSINDTVATIRSALIDYQKSVKIKRKRNEYV